MICMHIFHKPKQVAPDKWWARLSSCVSTSFPLTTLHRDTSGSLKTSVDQQVYWLGVPRQKTLWIKKLNPNALEILKVFSFFPLFQLAQFLLATMNNTQLPSLVFTTTSQDLGVVMVWRSNNPYFKGPLLRDSIISCVGFVMNMKNPTSSNDLKS